MSAKEYARLIREELYRQNKIVLEVPADLWLTIADNMEKFIEQVVERLQIELNLADEEKERYARENPLQFDVAKGYAHGISVALEIIKSGGVEND